MVKDFEILSFEFSFKHVPLCCPNCGYQVYNSLLNKANLSKSMIILGCGTILYLNYFKKEQLDSILNQVKTTFQYYGNSLLNFIYRNSSNISNNTIFQYYKNSTSNVSNQLFVANFLEEESNDFSSLNLSSLNSIGSSTVAKFDYLLDQVQQIKDCMNDSFDDLNHFHSPEPPLLERRLSEGEHTLPSLEWDLGDIATYHENSILQQNPDISHNSVGVMSNKVNYTEMIDSELLSQIIFNKDFYIKEDRKFKIKKQYIDLKQQLKFWSKNYSRRRNPNLDSTNYRTNRDSAFFEEL